MMTSRPKNIPCLPPNKLGQGAKAIKNKKAATCVNHLFSLTNLTKPKLMKKTYCKYTVIFDIVNS